MTVKAECPYCRSDDLVAVGNQPEVENNERSRKISTVKCRNCGAKYNLIQTFEKLKPPEEEREAIL
ncbi:MAG: hypothetical protein ACLFT7_05270 [Thermoplasmata archaeon]